MKAVEASRQFTELVPLLTRKDVARLAGVTTHTIKRDIKKGLLQEIPQNARRRRYHPDAVAAYLQAKYPTESYRNRHVLAQARSQPNWRCSDTDYRNGNEGYEATASAVAGSASSCRKGADHLTKGDAADSASSRILVKVLDKISVTLSVNVISGEIEAVPSVRSIDYGDGIPESTHQGEIHGWQYLAAAIP